MDYSVSDMPSYKFFPKSPQDVLAVLTEFSRRYPHLSKSSSIKLMRTQAESYRFPLWFTLSNDDALPAYLIDNEHYLAHLVTDYHHMSIAEYLAKESDGVSGGEEVEPTRHPHADLIEWWVESIDNQVEYLNGRKWRDATTPTWSPTTKYRRKVYIDRARPGMSALAEWANDQSLTLQSRIHSSNNDWDDEIGRSINAIGMVEYRIKPVELTELEKQAQVVLANPELIALITRELQKKGE